MFRFAILTAILFSPPLPAAEPAKKLNVIVMLIDDLGHTDLGCQGNTFHETPHIDQLAKDGLRFTNAYSACTVCSPTRAALLTGQYPARLHITDWIAGHVQPNAKLKVPDWQMSLDPKTFTLAKAFKNAGYATASIGKWHLGGEDSYPQKFGFDVNIGGTNKGQPPTYFSPFKIPTLKDGTPGEFLSDTLTTEACKWIETNKAKPFFLYFPHYGVHTPLMGKKEVVAKYKEKAAKLKLDRNATYAALVESIDDSVGTLRAKLKELKLDDNTVIIFTSDNGGLLGGPKNPITTNPPFRAGKGSAYEGGVRVPLIISLCRNLNVFPFASPDYRVPPGSEVVSHTVAPVTFSTPISTIDILPTFAKWFDLKVQEESVIDGNALTFTTLNHADANKYVVIPAMDRPLFWHYPHYHPGGATPYTAMRKGDWKLIEFFESGRFELYNLKDDVGEQKDLSAKAFDRGGLIPNVFWSMQKEMKDWRTSVGAQMPTPNPNFKPNLQGKDGTILLHSNSAEVHGKVLRYEPQPSKNTLGFWTNKDDYASWEFTVEKTGTFTVEILQGCGKGQGGSEAFVQFGETKLEFVVEDTGGFQEFKPRDVGTIVIEKAGKFTLELHAKTKAKAAVMDCRQIVLKPKP
ncbi:hypothetical protein BH11PLA2_BH11PLA2_36510 [soil metagenome]